MTLASSPPFVLNLTGPETLSVRWVATRFGELFGVKPILEGKERDTETQNDDFGARYYSWRFGRWLSSDWSAVPVPVPYANLTNPQTLNFSSATAF